MGRFNFVIVMGMTSSRCKRLAHVAHHKLQFRMTVEGSAEDNTNHVDRGFNVPTPSRAGQHIRHDRRKPAV